MPASQTQIYISLFVAIVIIAVYLLFFIITIISYQKKYQRLNRNLLLAEIKALETERSRIAKDLHDDFGQLLAAIKMQVESIVPLDESGEELIRNATRHINDTLHRMKTMSQNLMPQDLFRNGSVNNIRRYIEEINRTQSSIHIGFTFRGEHFFENNVKEGHLCRIIQELITNTLKHSKAKEMDIHVYHKKRFSGSSNKTMLHIYATDDGIGFNENTAGISGNCFGIRNIHDRVALMNGNISVLTAPGKGVQYEIKIPVS
ncbi:MAG: hypothetical protein NVS3B15_04100 [Sediminibacterium sp.]